MSQFWIESGIYFVHNRSLNIVLQFEKDLLLKKSMQTTVKQWFA